MLCSLLKEFTTNIHIHPFIAKTFALEAQHIQLKLYLSDLKAKLIVLKVLKYLKNKKDIKIGTRTFLEEEANDNDKSSINVPRGDLYEKLFRLSALNEENKNQSDQNRPDVYLTDKEKSSKTLSKKRFMQWREACTSSSTLGFRIEAFNVNRN